jgi:serine/threonine-protein kinase HipA
VWVAGIRAGLLERDARQEYIFAYPQETGSVAQVSLTMPVRLASWTSRELHPIFQMNLPEGALLEAIRRAIAKIIGEDDLSILRVTGGNQVGRNRFSLPGGDSPSLPETSESLEELLTYPDTGELSMNSLQNMPCVPAYQAFSPRCCSMQRDGAQWRHQTIL